MSVWRIRKAGYENDKEIQNCAYSILLVANPFPVQEQMNELDNYPQKANVDFKTELESSKELDFLKGNHMFRTT